jgi:hypothetical protein
MDVLSIRIQIVATPAKNLFFATDIVCIWAKKANSVATPPLYTPFFWPKIG